MSKKSIFKVFSLFEYGQEDFLDAIWLGSLDCAVSCSKLLHKLSQDFLDLQYSTFRSSQSYVLLHCMTEQLYVRKVIKGLTIYGNGQYFLVIQNIYVFFCRVVKAIPTFPLCYFFVAGGAVR